VLVERTLEVLSVRGELLERAAAFPGRTRERVVALAESEELFYRLFPQHSRALQLIRLAGQLAGAGGDRPGATLQRDSRLMLALMDTIRRAQEQRDLVLPHRRPEELAFTLWALMFGTRALMYTSIVRRQLGLAPPSGAARGCLDLLLDALQWRPLSTEWDYAATRRRAHERLLAREAPRARQAPG